MKISNRFLLVDDQKDIVDLIDEVLQKDGFSAIRRTYTGEDAIRICREFKPDVVILPAVRHTLWEIWAK